MSKGQSAAQWPLLVQQSFQHTLETAKRSIKTGFGVGQAWVQFLITTSSVTLPSLGFGLFI